jgi:hypothetical protein
VKRAAVFFVLAVTSLSAGPLPSPLAFRESGARIVAVGDVHGAADAFAAILQRAGLIDEKRAWRGGDATLVQTGDITDRGPQVRTALDLLMALEKQAASAGGRVHALLGNHEAMNMLGETRDATPAIFATFADAESGQRRERADATYVRIMTARSAQVGGGIVQVESKDEWLAQRPPGYLEYREAFGPRGRYGRWLRGTDAVALVGDTIFLHGGLNPDVSPPKLDDVNRQVRREIKLWDDTVSEMVDRKILAPLPTLKEAVDAAALELARMGAAMPARAGIDIDPADRNLIEGMRALMQVGTWSVLNPDGPLWFRGYASWTPEEGAAKLPPLLGSYKAARIVVGHTVLGTFRITPRFDNRAILIDTGMLSTHFKGGQASALEIQQGRLTAIYADRQEALASGSK